MVRLLIPLVLALLGGGVGIGAGMYLRPPPEEPAEADAVEEPDQSEDDLTPGTRPIPDRDRPPLDQRDFVRMTNQFVVPVLEEGEVTALVVLSISLETGLEMRSLVFSREPKIRSALLQVMFDHANAGGFSGNFTGAAQIQTLRTRMWEAVRPILGPKFYDVLVTDIARQDA